MTTQSIPTLKPRRLASGTVVWVDERGFVQPEPIETEDCWKCGGTGTYCISGATINGRFVGRTGTCFECQGKGYTTPEDDRRNDYYNRYVRRVYL